MYKYNYIYVYKMRWLSEKNVIEYINIMEIYDFAIIQILQKETSMIEKNDWKDF